MKWFLALLAGGAMPFAYAPFSFWPLSILSVAVLYFVIRDETPRQAFRFAAVYALPYFGIGVSWIYNSVHDFGSAAPPAAVAMTVLLVLILTLFPAAASAIHARFRGRSWLFNTALFASAWTIAELLRGWIFGGFPWLLVGYSQSDSVFRAFASYIGVYGVSWVLVFFASLLVVVLFAGNSKGGAPQHVKLARLGLLVPLLLLPLSGWLLLSVEHSSAKDTSLRFRLVQGNIPQELKFSRERLISSLETYMRLSNEDSEDVDIIVWPETAIPTSFKNVETVIDPFAQSLLEHGTEVLSGGFYRDGDNVYNAVRQLGGDRALYTKQHLVPFGEYVPFRLLFDFVSKFVIIPSSDLSRGSGPANLLNIKGENIGLSICYEDVFGEEMALSFPNAGVLVNVSNDAWFGERIAPYQHQQIARMRAIEFERPLMRITNTGVSSAINYRGEVLQSIPHSTEGFFDIDVTPRTGSTPYARVRNYPVWIFSLAVIALSMLFGRMTKNRHETV